SVAPERITFLTTFRDTPRSRQIALIALPCTKNARRIFAIVSTTSIPTSASTNHGSQCGPLYSGVPIGRRSPRKGGSSCTPIHNHVAVVGLARQDIARDVVLVDPLHDDHDRRLLVVEAVRHGLAKEPDHLLALDVALGLDDVVGVVEDDAVAALAGANTT